MASNELIIDDEFCRAIGNYFVSQGKRIDQIISEYVSILQELRTNAIVSGDAANALSDYIDYAGKLNKQIGKISANVEKQINSFLSAVDLADQYLF